MTDPTTTSCKHCRKPADDQDRMCSVCRAESACTELTENVTDALEIFLDAQYSPHDGPMYYRKSPAFDEDAPELAEIAAACEQVTAGIKRLIELALGRKVEMNAGPWHDFYDLYTGWHACLDWQDEWHPAPASDNRPGTVIEFLNGRSRSATDTGSARHRTVHTYKSDQE